MSIGILNILIFYLTLRHPNRIGFFSILFASLIYDFCFLQMIGSSFFPFVTLYFITDQQREKIAGMKLSSLLYYFSVFLIGAMAAQFIFSKISGGFFALDKNLETFLWSITLCALFFFVKNLQETLRNRNAWL